jgi:uncharacterized protein (DUF58 family)
MYLAGAYFGTVLHLLFVFFCIFPVLSFTSLLISYIRLDLTQDFSTSMPVKGDTVAYEVMLFNRSFLPIPAVKAIFETVSPSMDTELPSYTVSVEAGTMSKKIFNIHCPYRGEYTLGVSSLEIYDFFQLFSLKKKKQPKKFVVYPRIVELDDYSWPANVADGNSRNASLGLLPDPTLFQQLKEYRDGDPIRHIYWKKYASIGRPVLKEYEHTKLTGVRIYFDTRKNSWPGVNELEQEDVSVEILLALVKYLLEKNIHTSVVAPGWESGAISTQNREIFESFYKATINLRFFAGISPVAAYYEDRSTGNLESQTVIFITHVIDPGVFALRDHARVHELHFIANCASYQQGDLETIHKMIDSVKDFGAHGLCVSGGDTIREELSDRVFEAV